MPITTAGGCAGFALGSRDESFVQMGKLLQRKAGCRECHLCPIGANMAWPHQYGPQTSRFDLGISGFADSGAIVFTGMNPGVGPWMDCCTVMTHSLAGMGTTIGESFERRRVSWSFLRNMRVSAVKLRTSSMGSSGDALVSV